MKRKYRNIIMIYFSITLSLFGIILIILSEKVGTLGIVFSNIGIALTSSNLVGLLFNLQMRHHFLNETQEIVTNVFEANLKRYHNLENSGLIQIYQNFPLKEVISHIKNAQHSIRIFSTWINNLDYLREVLCDAIQRNCMIEILILDPTSPISKQRSIELGSENPEYASNQIRLTLERIKILIDEVRKDIPDPNITIRLYRMMPPFLMYSFDNNMIFSPMLKCRNALEGPHTEVRGENSWLFKTYDRQYKFVRDHFHTRLVYSPSLTSLAMEIDK